MHTDPSLSARHLLTYVLFAQSLYYIVTGLWPVMSMSSYVAVTGLKTDVWLVRTVGLLVTVIGASMLTAAVKQRLSLEVLILAIGSIAAFFLVDVIYVLDNTIGPIYLVDAVAQLLFLGFWYLGWKGGLPATGTAQDTYAVGAETP